jgi:hypothetical protein
MEHGRDKEQEDMLRAIICDGDDDITSQFPNESGEGMEGGDGSGEGMEEEDNGSGVGTLIITKSGEVY